MRELMIALMCVQGLAVSVLTLRGLSRPFGCLIAYLAGSLLRGLLLRQSEPGTQDWVELWLWTLPFVMVLQVLTVVEAGRRSLAEVPGVQKSIPLAVASVSLLAAAVAQIGQTTFTATNVLARGEQAVTMVLALVMTGMAVWIGILRPHRLGNIVWHERILVAHLAGVAILLFLYHRGTIWAAYANGLVSIACCVAWMVMLRPEGEEPRSSGRPPDARDRVAAREMGRAGRSLWTFVRQR